MTNIIYRAIVGSHMWKMERPESDTDIFEIYVQPTSEYLVEPSIKSTHTIVDEVDTASHEIGSVIHQLIKGNFMMMLQLNSPIVKSSLPPVWWLRDHQRFYISKNMLGSVYGMIEGNIKKYASEGDTPRWGKLLRVIYAAEHALVYGTMRYMAVNEDKLEVLKCGLDRLREFEQKPDTRSQISQEDKDKLLDHLRQIRISNLNTEMARLV